MPTTASLNAVQAFFITLSGMDWPARRTIGRVRWLLLAVLGAAAALSVPVASSQQASPAEDARPKLGHVFLLLMENKDYAEVIGNPDAPYLNDLAARFTLGEDYHAIRHPSLPNYLALLTGSTLGVTDDCTDCFFDARSLVDSLEARGRTWKSYQEDLPEPCFLGVAADAYAMRHDPFVYLRSVRDDAERCQHVVPLTQLDADLAAGSPPDLIWITPNVRNDMHDESVAFGDRWLAGFVPRILESPAWQANGALMIVWDEGRSATPDTCCAGAVGGHVPFLLLTPTRPAGVHLTMPLTHYGLLAGIERAWGLDRLGHSADADAQAMADGLSLP